MVREVITICLGQAGVQLGTAIWDQYLAEHQIDPTGKLKSTAKKTTGSTESFLCFFDKTQAGQYVPRNLSVDLEPNTLDDVKASKNAAIFNNDFLLHGKEDAANNFARGHYTVGKDIIDKVNDRIRKLVDNCDNVMGFFVNHSVGGGTGSGLGCLVLEKLAVDYKKKSRLGFEIYPSPTISTCVVEPYNAILASHWLMDHIQVSLLLDNEAVYEICQRKLDLTVPDYENLNRVISKVLSSMTASLRFEGEMNVDLNEFQTNLVPFPRLHFMTTALSPMVSQAKVDTMKTDIQSIVEICFDPQSFLVKLPNFNPEKDLYLAVSLNFRGPIQSKDANATVQWLKSKGKVKLVEWCPTGFKVGLNREPPAVTEEDDMAPAPKNVAMIANNTAIQKVFVDRVAHKYDLMYAQRAFVHWYVGEGMEEGEFAEAREDIQFLERDFTDVLKPKGTDEEAAADDSQGGDDDE